jgi:hypothetical protein
VNKDLKERTNEVKKEKTFQMQRRNAAIILFTYFLKEMIHNKYNDEFELLLV